jgi:DNA-directed RNA polymerase subunit RPC12/RpoP
MATHASAAAPFDAAEITSKFFCEYCGHELLASPRPAEAAGGWYEVLNSMARLVSEARALAESSILFVRSGADAVVCDECGANCEAGGVLLHMPSCQVGRVLSLTAKIFSAKNTTDKKEDAREGDAPRAEAGTPPCGRVCGRCAGSRQTQAWPVEAK